MEMKKYPNSFKIGGQKIEVRNVERCSDNSIGECHTSAGYVEIADKFNKDEVQSDDVKRNTFYHELTHAILRTIGEYELNDNEKFVCCFSSLLCEAMESARFIEYE